MLVWHIGDVVRKIRATRAIVGKQIQSQTGVKPNTVSRVEKGMDFLPSTMEKIASALGMTTMDLYAQVPHAPEECPARKGIVLPDDDPSRRLASLWANLSPSDRQLVVQVLTAMTRGGAGP